MIRNTRWLVVGGGQGIAFQQAYRLGLLGAERLVLVGESEPGDGFPDAHDTQAIKELRKRIMKEAYTNGQSPRDVWEQVQDKIELQCNLRQLRESEISFEYVVCGVTNREDFTARLHDIYGHRGFDGVIYGLEWERRKRLLKRDHDEFRKTLDYNLGAMETLCQYIDRLHDSLLPRWFVVNSSLPARFGAACQIDYALAKGVSSSLVKRLGKRWNQCRAIEIEWPKWQGVGMTADSENRLILKTLGHHTIQIDEGLRHFERELLISSDDTNISLVHPDEIPVRMRGNTERDVRNAE